MNDYQGYHDFACVLISQAQTFLLEQKTQGFKTMTKNRDVCDVVTTVDLAVNDFLIDAIKKQYPEHNIYSEEGSSPRDEISDWQWVLDPIDGTSHFARGRMLYSISIGLLHQNQPKVNVVCAAETGDVYSWYQNGSVSRNKQECWTTQQIHLKGSQVALRSGRSIELASWGGRFYTALIEEKVKVYNFGSSALDLCYLASGSLDAVIYGGITTQDIAGSIAMVEAAGGVVTDKEGKRVVVSQDSQTIYAAASGELNDALRKLLEL